MGDKKTVDYKYNFKTYWNFLKKYKPLLLLVLFSTLIIEVSWVADKIVFKELVDHASTFFSGGSQELFIHAILTLLLVLTVILGLRVLSKWIQQHFNNLLESSLIFDLKRKYFNYILTLSHEFHISHKTGSLISRLSRGGRAIERMTDILVYNLVPFIFQFVTVFIALIYFKILSVIIIMSAVIIVFIAFGLWITKIRSVTYKKFDDADDREKGMISNFFTNVDAIKYFGKEKNIQQRYNEANTTTRNTLLQAWNYHRWMDSGQYFILGLGLIAIIAVTFKSFLAGSITLGTLIFVYTIYGNLTGPLFQIVDAIKTFYDTMADFQALFAYGEIQQTVKDIPNARKATVKHGQIAFKNVSFRYRDRLILKNFTLHIPAHKKIALVGPSGAGKSTIIKLLYRFHDVERGQILLDNEDIRNFEQESLRSELSIVPQDCILFDDTIYNNIAFSKPHASRQEVLKAIKLSQLDQIINTFPEKENTIVGERGIKLSGGEKQRVSIARAILADKKILVLDEATSSLDSETEHAIQEALEILMKGRTSIIIAHRLSTIMKADYIVVLSHGKIEQIDTHRNLIKKDGLYRKLWSLQKGGYIE